MKFHCALRQIERRSDFLVSETAYHAVQNFFLAARQLDVRLDGASRFQELLSFFGQILQMSGISFD